MAAAFAVSASLSFYASAADLGGPRQYTPPPAPYVQPMDYSWAGWYFGGVLGYGTGDVDFAAPAGSFSADQSGLLGGGLLGWNAQQGNFVYGIEGDLVATDIDGRRAFGPNVLTNSTDWMAGLRARAGITVMPHLLIFATLGAGWADMNLNVTGPGGGSGSETFVGLQVGGGAEVQLSRNWNARFDYLYTDFSSETLSYPLGSIKFDPDVHQLRGALVYRF